MIYKNLYKNDLNFIERNKHLILYNPGESINPLQILPILLLCIKHTCSQNEFLPFQPLHHRAATGKTKELSKDARDITVDLHKVKRPSVRSSCNFLPIPIISNYFQLFENRWNLKWSLSPSICKILPHELRMIMKKVLNQPKTTWKELVKDLKVRRDSRWK